MVPTSRSLASLDALGKGPASHTVLAGLGVSTTP